MTSWTTSADVETKVRRRWASGALLRAHTLGEPFEAIRVTLRTPAAADLSERLEEIRRWAADLERRSDNGRRFELESKVVGGRTIGRSTLPGRAIVRSYEQAWRLLGVREDVRRFDGVLAATAGRPAVTDWVVAHPLRAVSLAEEWPSILTALESLDWNAGTGLYLRQVDAPGVDTKFIERHRGVLAALLAVRTSAQGFVTDLGFAAKPPRVRLRFDPDTLRLPAPLTEAELRTDELAELPVEIAQALIVENEVTYLSVPDSSRRCRPLRARIRRLAGGLAPVAAVGRCPRRCELLGRHRHARVPDPEPRALPPPRRALSTDGPRHPAAPRGAMGPRGQPDECRAPAPHGSGECTVRRRHQ